MLYSKHMFKLFVVIICKLDIMRLFNHDAGPLGLSNRFPAILPHISPQPIFAQSEVQLKAVECRSFKSQVVVIARDHIPVHEFYVVASQVIKPKINKCLHRHSASDIRAEIKALVRRAPTRERATQNLKTEHFHD